MKIRKFVSLLLLVVFTFFSPTVSTESFAKNVKDITGEIGRDFKDAGIEIKNEFKKLEVKKIVKDTKKSVKNVFKSIKNEFD